MSIKERGKPHISFIRFFISHPASAHTLPVLSRTFRSSQLHQPVALDSEIEARYVRRQDHVAL